MMYAYRTVSPNFLFLSVNQLMETFFTDLTGQATAKDTLNKSSKHERKRSHLSQNNYKSSTKKIY